MKELKLKLQKLKEIKMPKEDIETEYKPQKIDMDPAKEAKPKKRFGKLLWFTITFDYRQIEV